ncbi:MAG TPA: hypothetical protein DCR87_00095 [Acidobacteria bacterium]|nr:hypothetical protein [Acidobacteriota bacterium]
MWSQSQRNFQSSQSWPGRFKGNSAESRAYFKSGLNHKVEAPASAESQATGYLVIESKTLRAYPHPDCYKPGPTMIPEANNLLSPGRTSDIILANRGS